MDGVVRVAVAGGPPSHEVVGARCWNLLVHGVADAGILVEMKWFTKAREFSVILFSPLLYVSLR